MNCISCGAKTSLETATDVMEFGNSLIIVRNVPCHKCSECNEIIYTADVVRRLEEIAETAKQTMNEIAIINYNSNAA